MAVEQSMATLRIVLSRQTAASITERLSIAPTQMHEAGEPNGRTRRPWRAAQWSLTSTLLQTEPLESHLAELLDLVEPVSAVLHALDAEGCAMDWFCFIGRDNNGQGGPEFSPAMLRRLGALPVALTLDAY